MQRRVSTYSGGSQRYTPYGGRAPQPSSPQIPQIPQLSQMQGLANPYAAFAAAASDPAQQQLLASQLYAAYSHFPPPMLPGAPPVAQGPAGVLPPDAMKVSKETTVKALAGKLAHRCREGEPPEVVARGAAINIAVKGIAVAISFLKDSGCSLSVSPYHCNDGDNTTGRSVIFRLKKVAIEPEVQPSMTLKVAKTSIPSKTAGYLASKIRAAGTKKIAVQSVGAEAVENAVNTLVLARRYLKLDGKTTGVQSDFTVTPTFATIMLGDKTTSALQFFITMA